MTKFILLFTILYPLINLVNPYRVQASQQLSSEVRMSLLTAGPGEELYSVFGHSALWVYDPVRGIDEVYNWGTFDFDTPNFYLKFLQGRLMYKLSVVPLMSFLPAYHYEGRWVTEQVLNLPADDKQRIYDALQMNRLPQNVHYLYDFFYVNCATRIRDVIDDNVAVDWGPDPHPHEERSFRDMLQPYVGHMPWIDFGIDILLGIPSDKRATPWHYMFLPDEMLIAFQHARHTDGQLLVTKTNELLPEEIVRGRPFPFTPLWVFWFVFIAGCLSLLRKRIFYAFSGIYFFLLGLLGLLVFFLWFLSDHVATAMNLNLLWTLPTHLYFVFRIRGGRLPGLAVIYFRLVFFISAGLLVLWPVIPQDFHPAFFPVIALSAVFSAALTDGRKVFTSALTYARNMSATAR